MASPLIAAATPENFDQQVLKSPTPVLVDFWAEWCGPCKMIGPALDELATEYEGRAKIVKVNIEDGANQQLAAQYRISSLPTFLVFKNGEVVAQHLGIAGGKPKLKSMLDGVS